MTAPNTAEKVCRGTPNQSAHLPYSRDSSTRTSPTSKTTALITLANLDGHRPAGSHSHGSVKHQSAPACEAPVRARQQDQTDQTGSDRKSWATFLYVIKAAPTAPAPRLLPPARRCENKVQQTMQSARRTATLARLLPPDQDRTAMAISVRQASYDDVQNLAHVQLTTVIHAYAGIFPAEASPPSLESLVTEWRGSFDARGFRAFLAEDSNLPVGTVAIRADPDFADLGQLERLHVVPERWNGGIGSALYEAAIKALQDGGYREAGLWVLEANDRARDFYEKRGWKLLPGRTLTWPGLNVVEFRYSLAIDPL